MLLLSQPSVAGIVQSIPPAAMINDMLPSSWARIFGSGAITEYMTSAPSFSSHLIAAVTLAIPAMILAETALSFLGLGLQPPVVSWGVLLQGAQNFRSVALAPWLLLPGLFVVIVILAFNFAGDGLRDAADPYAI